MVQPFVVPSVLMGYHEYKDLGAAIDRAELLCEREPSNPKNTWDTAAFTFTAASYCCWWHGLA